MTSTKITIDTLKSRLAEVPEGTRKLIALVGPPGSGKSTVAEQLVEALNAISPGRAAVLPMDGYHLDDGLLMERGLLARKGAPETFDVGGLAFMLQRLRENAEGEIAVPVFDRSIEISRAGGRVIAQSVDFLVVEGNYLLLDMEPWTQLESLFDLTVLLEVSEVELRRRLEQRWVDLGLDAEAVRDKVDGNDLPNARLVLHQSKTPDHTLENEA